MKKTVYIILIAIIVSKLQAQQNSNQSMTEKLTQSSYVFEGIIENIEIYAGDKFGNKLPNSSAKWENGVAYFYNADGSEAKAFSLAKIKICKPYKGTEIKSIDYVSIITTADGLQAFRQVNGTDTILNHMYFNNSHDDAFVITNSMRNYRIIFFANKNSKGQFTLHNKEAGIFINQNYERDIKNLPPEKVEYASADFKRFNSLSDLNDFLKLIPNLDITVKDKCLIEKKKLKSKRKSTK